MNHEDDDEYEDEMNTEEENLEMFKHFVDN